MSGPVTVTLSRDDRAVLARASEAVATHGLAAAEEYVLEAQIQAARLSDDLRRRLQQFRRFGDRGGALLVRGVPLGEVPLTPARVALTEGPPAVAAAAMSILLAGLGEQYGFRPELGGRIIQDIVPVQGFETQQISLGSTVDLDRHTEMAFSDLRSDYVALLCLREDHDRQAATTISSIDSMLPLLDEATIGILGDPRFRTKVDKSFLIGDDLSEDVWVDPIRVLSGPVSRPHLRVDFAETEAKDEAAAAALTALSHAAEQAQIVVRLTPGDLLVVDNHRALHGRTLFRPRYDGADRWLLRSFITKDLRASEVFRDGDSRVVEPDYRPDRQ